MSFRDDHQAAVARIAGLERELAEAKRRIAELDGTGSQALVRSQSKALASTRDAEYGVSRFAGGVIRLVAERVLDGELFERAHTEMIEHLRDGFGNMGTVTSLPGSIVWVTQVAPNTSIHQMTLRISSRDGKTLIRLEENLSQLAAGIVGGLGLGVGVTVGSAGLVLIAINPLLGVAASLLTGGGIFGWSRRLYRSRAEKRGERIEALADELVEIARPHLRPTADEDEG